MESLWKLVHLLARRILIFVRIANHSRLRQHGIQAHGVSRLPFPLPMYSTPHHQQTGNPRYGSRVLITPANTTNSFVLILSLGSEGCFRRGSVMQITTASMHLCACDTVSSDVGPVTIPAATGFTSSSYPTFHYTRASGLLPTIPLNTSSSCRVLEPRGQSRSYLVCFASGSRSRLRST